MDGGNSTIRPNFMLDSQTKASRPNEPTQTLKPDNALTTDFSDKKNINSKELLKEGKVSGAEMKKRAKEEKAAKRAREKLIQQQQSPKEFSGGGKKDAASESSKKGNAASVPETSVGPKHQHKRAGSTSTTSQRPLAIRPAEPQPVPITPELKRENKKVALFGHLYGHPRRTTIAGAGKDVHPATLALGLQMSNYVICGSNARCIATLLVFKRVSPYDLEPSKAELINYRSSNHI